MLLYSESSSDEKRIYIFTQFQRQETLFGCLLFVHLEVLKLQNIFGWNRYLGKGSVWMVSRQNETCFGAKLSAQNCLA